MVGIHIFFFLGQKDQKACFQVQTAGFRECDPLNTHFEEIKLDVNV